MGADEAKVIQQVRAILSEAIEERRGLVVYSRMEAVELDQLARRYEREAMDKVRGLLPEMPFTNELEEIRRRLARMDEQVSALDAIPDIAEKSRQLERDDIIWRAFEDISHMLGLL